MDLRETGTSDFKQRRMIFVRTGTANYISGSCGRMSLPPTLSEKCRQAFVSQPYWPSKLQDDVISELSSIGMSPEEEVLTLSGYRLDAIVEVNGEKVGIEVDGPTHFVNQFFVAVIKIFYN